MEGYIRNFYPTATHPDSLFVVDFYVNQSSLMYLDIEDNSYGFQLRDYRFNADSGINIIVVPLDTIDMPNYFRVNLFYLYDRVDSTRGLLNTKLVFKDNSGLQN